MKVLLYTDVHWCQYSSIVRGRGEEFSLRLEKIISGLNWAEKLADDSGCDFVVCLGDFFDTSELNAEEISALERIQLCNKKHFFICGNHEMGRHDLSYNSAKFFNSLVNCETVSSPMEFQIPSGKYICFLPYITESDRLPIDEYFKESVGKSKIIFSHNDIAGIQMGQFISKTGFSIDEIEASCDKFLNGHLHNGEKITDKIINLGNLCGQNFSEDAEKYDHCAFILDTDTLRLAGYENPYSINFYKFENRIPGKLKNNAVITLKCKEEQYDKFKNELEHRKTSGEIIEYRIIIEREKLVSGTSFDEEIVELNTVDHLKRFSDYVHENIGVSDIINEEIERVVGVVQ